MDGRLDRPRLERLAASYEYCRMLHRTHGRSYYLATRLLPARKRLAVHALYGFTRYTDEIVDAFDGADAQLRARRLRAWRDRFAAAARPVWRAEASPARFWGEWLDLASGAGLPPDDPRSLLIRRTVGGRVFASLSVTLVGLGEEGVRYDFCPCPEDPGSWHQVRATG